MLAVGLIHHHRLEAAGQGGVLFNVLAVVIQGGGADALQLAPGQSRFQDACRVNGAFRFSGTHNALELVNKQDDAAVILNLIHHILHPLLKLAPVFGACHQAAQIKGQEALAGKRFRHFPRDDALGQPFCHGAFPHTGGAYQDRVVLGAPG